VIGDPEISAMLGDKGRSLQDICVALIAAANAGGGPDNITALVLEVDVS
jgi:serine/threonine protein phosphatase PrpC